MLSEHFWRRVDRRGPDECWQWTAGKFTGGYGAYVQGGKTKTAHRVAYEDSVGPIPDGLQIDHLCRNRSCVNPAHLEPVTIRENVLRGEGITAVNAAKTHCKRGHEFTEENTRLRLREGKSPARECWECHRMFAAEHRARKRAA